MNDRFAQKYTMLPLDEPHFIIDANTRAITVPSEFKKNGIAVQGDDLAEVVYFEIDRYFDAVDFNNCEIYIQWELPKSKTQGVCPAYTKDISSKPGKLIFGWPISHDITGNAGSMKISVQIYQMDESNGKKVINYSFNTLTTTVTVNASIGIDITSEDLTIIDGVGARLVARIEDGVIAGGAEAAAPVFSDDIEGVYELEDGSYTLKALAYTTDTGAISYTWERADLDEETNEVEGPYGDVDEANVSIEYVEAEELVAGHVYWYEINGGYSRYIATGSENIEDGKTYYRKMTTCTITKTGAYRVVAKNRITNSINTTESKVAYCKHPLVPTVTDLEESGIIGVNAEIAVSAIKSDEAEVLSYQWQKSERYQGPSVDGSVLSFSNVEGATDAVFEAEEQGRYRVAVTSSRNGEAVSVNSSVCRITNAAEVPEYENYGLIFEADALTDDNCPTIVIDNINRYDSYDVEWYVYESGKRGAIAKMSYAYTDSDEVVSKMNPANYADKVAEITGGNDLIANYYCIVTANYNGTQASTEAPTVSSMFEVMSEE